MLWFNSKKGADVMFGYVRICREMLDDKSFEDFRAYYCGLCKAIGKYSHSARLGLSYDMTFLLVLLSAVSDDEVKIVNSRCMLHPWRKEKKTGYNHIVDYVACMSIILTYRKFDDDLKDENSLKAWFGKLLYSMAMKKAVKKYKHQDSKIQKLLGDLSELELNNCQNSDEVADCFAKICEIIFVPEFITNENNRQILAWLGYNTGRWIYLIDALDDYENDIKKNAYNPFSSKGKTKEELAKELNVTLTYTLSNIAGAYDLLDINRNDAILRNIIYCGMDGIQTNILKLWEENDGSL